MEVRDPCCAFLCNREVFDLLNSLKLSMKQSAKPDRPSRNLSTVVYECTKYLEQSQCAAQDAESVTAFLNALSQHKFGLTKAEKLQLVNQCPRSAVELSLLIEESSERLTEENEQILLELITKYFPGVKSSAQINSSADENISAVNVDFADNFSGDELAATPMNQ